METRKIYVWATDKFLSNWGCASGKIHKQIVICNGWNDAERIIRGMQSDTTFSYVNYGYRLPYFSPSRYTTTTRPSSDYMRFK